MPPISDERPRRAAALAGRRIPSLFESEEETEGHSGSFQSSRSKSDFASPTLRRSELSRRVVVGHSNYGNKENSSEHRNYSPSSRTKPAEVSVIRESPRLKRVHRDVRSHVPEAESDSERGNRTEEDGENDDDFSYKRSGRSTKMRRSTRRVVTSDESGSSESESESESEDEIVSTQRRLRERRERDEVRFLRERRATRQRRSETERLLEALTNSQRSVSADALKKAQMEDDDAALAAAIAAGYFSDEEVNRAGRDASNDTSSSRRQQPPYHNPYERRPMNGYSNDHANQQPTRRSGRMAAVVSAARVALLSSLFNPEDGESGRNAGTGDSEPPPPPYNLRTSRASNSAAASPYANIPLERLMNFGADLIGTEDDPHPHGRKVTGSGSSADQAAVDADEMNLSGSAVPHEAANHGDDAATFALSSLEDIAGMGEYVRRLKEMIVFPLVYPHLFAKLNISLPRGVLFHGPPGTGKTLMARLLASACSTSTRKVSFFMRNGSDCLSKWIGEAERNMRLLFKKAKECQPAIIFFDEIDGLAPERTGRQDQSHISLVSTLLALMDGLDDRGQVIVIGATNRIHSLDAALRRPGRFDREFFFGLPDASARKRILQIHTKSWTPQPAEDVLDALAERTFGFSGADMKGLCVEAALRAVQRAFPEAYASSVALPVDELDEARISVQVGDFETALLQMTPSTRRHVSVQDLVGLEVPQALLYREQLGALQGLLIKDAGIKRGIGIRDSAGRPGPQVLNQMAVKVVYDAAVHPEAYVWRFLASVAGGLDGFAMESVDLAESVGVGAGGVDGWWNRLREIRSRQQPVVLLLKSLMLLTKEARQDVIGALRMFLRSLAPGEPILVLLPVMRRKKTTDPSLEKPMPAGTFHRIRSFELKGPTMGQAESYAAAVLASVYRCAQSSNLVMSVPEGEFVDLARDRFAPEVESIGGMEKARICLMDRVLTDARATVEWLSGRDDIISEEVREMGNFESTAAVEDPVLLSNEQYNESQNFVGNANDNDIDDSCSTSSSASTLSEFE